jgi:hypothetical protein
MTLRFETIAGPGEPQRPFRRQRVIARHSTKPTWTQSLLRLGWCRERVRVPQEVTDAAVIEAGAAKRLQRVKTVRELSVVGPCITLGLVLRETGRRISYRDRQGKLKFISRQLSRPPGQAEIHQQTALGGAYRTLHILSRSSEDEIPRWVLGLIPDGRRLTTRTSTRLKPPRTADRVR